MCASAARCAPLMQALTPLVEPLSIDEAFLDLAGTERLHRRPPALALARSRPDASRRRSASPFRSGLCYNKFLAKVASDLDKPRGFSVIGEAEAVGFLAEQAGGLIWGVGKAFAARLARDGIRTSASCSACERGDLMRRYGVMGDRLYHLCARRGRPPGPSRRPAKSVSAETTFDTDIADSELLAATLWPLCEKVSAAAEAHGLAGGSVHPQAQDLRFQTLTRSAGCPRRPSSPRRSTGRPCRC